MRQSLSKTVISGTRSGNRLVVYEHYDSLKLIWGGSANTQPLQNGVDNSTIALDEESESAINSSTDVENGTLHDQSDHESDLDSEGDDLSCIDSPKK